MATTALSRASLEDKVAPAYLLSGTRGVGKTTIARIFAKALNCEHAPAGEPCNECVQCAQITAGNHVDVCEIDGASNTGVDDVRALRENVGYMPMQGRYKIFIMDEAHMLSKSAFNALLKTLEEPPGHTVFIFATTEAHRFPATIVSRCQHFVFRHQPEDVLHAHLLNILAKEKLEHDPAAIRLIARRAAGSVRDSLSLLDQTLALAGGKKLDAELVRQSLGLAGLEFFEALFKALPARGCGEIARLCETLLKGGIDIGFFIRELSSIWRNLFLYRQEGEKILARLGLAPDEINFLKNTASAFSPAHLHAAWQMTLENQKSIIQNPEPGPALELLLLNLALLPQLLPVGNVPPPPVGSCGETPPAPEKFSQPAGLAVNETAGAYGDSISQTPSGAGPAENSSDGRQPPTEDRWKGFCDYCENELDPEDSRTIKDILHGVSAQWRDEVLKLSFPSQLAMDRFSKKRLAFDKALKNFCKNRPPQIILDQTQLITPEKEELLKECGDMPQVRLCMEILGGDIADCRPKPQEPTHA